MKGWIIIAISIASLALLSLGLHSYLKNDGNAAERVVLDGYDRYIPENVREGDVKKKRD